MEGDPSVSFLIFHETNPRNNFKDFFSSSTFGHQFLHTEPFLLPPIPSSLLHVDLEMSVADDDVRHVPSADGVAPPKLSTAGGSRSGNMTTKSKFGGSAQRVIGFHHL